jgi:hypothetical protein
LLDISYNQPKFCPNATWNEIGIHWIEADKSFYSPQGIFVDIENNIYVSYVGNLWGTGQVWMSHRTSNWWSNLNELATPSSLFATLNGDVYIDNGAKGWIEKWASNGIANQISLPDTQSCYGLFVDINNAIYCSVKDSHRVIKQSLESGADKTWKIAAGIESKRGSAASMLAEPRGLFVDTNFDLYVADWGNDRIQLFQLGQTNGTTVVNNTVQFRSKSLHQPTSIVLDADRNLYIVDSENHRVIFVAVDFSQHRCLVGCSGNAGWELYKMNGPTGISFDSSGNMFISDTNNKRLLKFDLNTSLCGKLAKYSVNNK